MRLPLNAALNTWGTIVYCAAQWLTTVLVVRLGGYLEAGTFAIAISYANIFYAIAVWGTRNYLLSDVKHEFTNGIYFGGRIVATLTMFLIFLFPLLPLGFNLHTIACISAYMVYKAFEAGSDICMGFLQCSSRYMRLAVSYSIRGILPVAVFALVLGTTQSLLYAVAAMAAVNAAAFFLFDLPDAFKRENAVPQVYGIIKGIAKLNCRCTPVMVISLSLPFMNFISRYFVERLYSQETVGFYSSISAITATLVTLGGAVWMVIVPQVSALFLERKNNLIKLLLVKICVLFALAGGLILVGASVLGEFAFSLVYGEEILASAGLILPMTVTAIVLTAVSLLNTILIAFQKHRFLLLCNVTGAGLCGVLAYPLTAWLGEYGANSSMLIALAVQLILSTFFIAKALRENQGGTPCE